MELTDDDIVRPARAIATRIDPAALLTATDVGAILKVSARHVAERYAKTPGFPAPVSLPTESGGRSHPRWQSGDIVAWISTKNPSENPNRERVGRPRNPIENYCHAPWSPRSL